MIPSGEVGFGFVWKGKDVGIKTSEVFERTQNVRSGSPKV
jgi:hypothetical protein